LLSLISHLPDGMRVSQVQSVLTLGLSMFIGIVASILKSPVARPLTLRIRKIPVQKTVYLSFTDKVAF
jgi:hypothetical protein